jgi:hypothetical protein
LTHSHIAHPYDAMLESFLSAAHPVDVRSGNAAICADRRHLWHVIHCVPQQQETAGSQSERIDRRRRRGLLSLFDENPAVH